MLALWTLLSGQHWKLRVAITSTLSSLLKVTTKLASWKLSVFFDINQHNTLHTKQHNAVIAANLGRAFGKWENWPRLFKKMYVREKGWNKWIFISYWFPEYEIVLLIGYSFEDCLLYHAFNRYFEWWRILITLEIPTMSNRVCFINGTKENRFIIYHAQHAVRLPRRWGGIFA